MFTLLPPSHPIRRRLVQIALFTLVLIAAERGVRAWLEADAAPAEGAQWIWSADPSTKTAPRAFWAAADFAVHDPRPGSHLSILADEEYVAYLNGRRIGSGTYFTAADLDVYAVDEALLEGTNRLLVELRSGRGSGGLLVGLEDGDGDPLLVSGGDWRIFREPDPGLRGGWSSLEKGEAPRIWGRPPIGRWGDPREGALEPSFNQTVASAPLLAAVGAETRQSVSGVDGPWQVWDFGREVTGYLEIDFGPATVPAALLYGGTEVPTLGPSAALDSIILPRGGRVWTATLPHALRYAVIVGRRSPVSVVLWPLAEGVEVGGDRGTGPAEGILGIEPPESLPVVEAWVRERLAADR